ncbi:hypothetical protein [Engelhardtia mirabilis]|uniref:Uncharacterized protein n=1 Tax=Engelhardtia mirabilis TaxID=2528011 RepID=A0A518BQF9_9BACT|nr:hypothetical protein Pla133_43250 [Planctomycetes bacterium Pla133]QDV03535.1 hypothetical protein Pla86_43240 [Planctomycetes bacterium Pla86]
MRNRSIWPPLSMLGRSTASRPAPLDPTACAPSRVLRGALLAGLCLALALGGLAGCKTGQKIGWGTPTAPKVLREVRGRGFDYGPLPERDGEETTANFERRLERHYYARYERLLAELDSATEPQAAAAALASLERHRDRVLYDLLTEVDDAYFQFEKQLVVGPGVSNLIWDWVDLGLDATAAAMTPVATKSILSTIATGVEGARLSVDKNIWRQQVYELINQTMRAARQEVLNEIQVRLAADRASPGFDYPLEEVVRDVGRYYYAGSVTTALARMVERAGDDYQREQEIGFALRDPGRADGPVVVERTEPEQTQTLESLRTVLRRLDSLDARLER